MDALPLRVDLLNIGLLLFTSWLIEHWLIILHYAYLIARDKNENMYNASLNYKYSSRW